jgi:hypothetical protein
MVFSPLVIAVLGYCYSWLLSLTVIAAQASIGPMYFRRNQVDWLYIKLTMVFEANGRIKR